MFAQKKTAFVVGVVQQASKANYTNEVSYLRKIMATLNYKKKFSLVS
jgi:hypothetical protein